MMELTRTITFGQYINNGSAIMRMDPRIKLLCMILIIALVSFISHFVAFACSLIFFFFLYKFSHVSLSYAMRSLIAFIPFFIFIVIMQILFYYSPTQHTTQLWHWWIFTVSWEGILFSAHIVVRIVLVYYLVSMLMFTTSLVDLTDGADALLSPLQRIGIPTGAFVMVLVIAFKFVPIFLGEIERLIKAQSARGVNFSKGNLFQRALRLGTLLVPLFVSAFKRADSLTIAMEARCYGGRPGWRRSKRRAFHLTRFDLLMLLLTLVTCVLAVAANYISPY